MDDRPVTGHEQRLRALAAANHKRVTRRFYRDCVLDGRIELRDLLLDPPVELYGLTVLDLMSMPYSRKQSYSGPWKEKLGKSAVRDGVNLLLPIERASSHTREWAARQAWDPRSATAMRKRAGK